MEVMPIPCNDIAQCINDTLSSGGRHGTVVVRLMCGKIHMYALPRSCGPQPREQRGGWRSLSSFNILLASARCLLNVAIHSWPPHMTACHDWAPNMDQTRSNSGNIFFLPTAQKNSPPALPFPSLFSYSSHLVVHTQ